MNKVRLNLGKLSVPQLISYAQRVRAALERDPAFSRHNDDLRLLEEEIIELAERHEDLDEAVRLAQERAAERDVLRGSVEALLGDLAEEVAELSRQQPELLRRSGFDPLPFRHAHPEIALEQSSAFRPVA